MKRVITIILFVCVLSWLSGCQTIPKLIHGHAEQKKLELIKDMGLTVSVVPLTDKRLSINRYGTVYRYLIPLVPYGTISYERPETGKMFNSAEEALMFNTPSLSEALSKIIYQRINNDKLFTSVSYAADPAVATSDLIISGEIDSTLYEGKTYSYGISFLGPVLWSIGLPAGSARNKLNITLYLRKKDAQNVLWTYTIIKEKVIIQGLYYNREQSVNNYAILLQEGMTEAIEDLDHVLSKISLDEIKTPAPPPAPAPEVPKLKPQEVVSEAKDAVKEIKPDQPNDIPIQKTLPTSSSTTAESAPAAAPPVETPPSSLTEQPPSQK